MVVEVVAKVVMVQHWGEVVIVATMASGNGNDLVAAVMA